MKFTIHKPQANFIKPKPIVLAMSLATVLTLSGCAAVGPDFKTPAPIVQTDEVRIFGEVNTSKQIANAPVSAGQSQRFVRAQAIPAEWWGLFHSDALDKLVRLGLQNSPSLVSAQATLRQAQANYEAVAGTYFPSVTASGTPQRQHAAATQTNTPGGAIYNLFNASVSVSYTFDVFGGQRRNLEALSSSIDSQRYQVEAAYLSLSANIVTAAIQEASLRAQIKTTEEMLAVQEKSLDVVRKQEKIGSISRGPVLAQETQATQTRAQLPALYKALEQTRYQLALLVGTVPNDANLPTINLNELTLPDNLPLSLPSELVRQRPDIQASEALLHQANAQVGVATANLYPSFTISGSAGSSAFTFNKLFEPGFGFWSLIGGVTAPLFDGGALRAKQRASLAALDGAAAQYRQTVLAAFQNVASTLSALQHDATTLQMQANAESVAKQSLELTQYQYQAGSVTYLNVLDAQRSYQVAKVALVQAQAARYADSAALLQALGGGWWNREAKLADVKLAEKVGPATAAK